MMPADAIPTLVRATASVVVLLAVYAVLPLEATSRGAFVLRTSLAGIAIVALLSRELRRFLRSPGARRAVVELLAVGVPLLILGFAAVYAILSDLDGAAFTEPLDHVGALYFSMTTTTTLGYGDIAPRTDAARIATMLHMVANVVLLGVVARELVARSSARRS